MTQSSGIFPFSAQVKPTFLAAPPEAADCVIVGGGIIGLMAAWYLAKSGKSVVVVEKGVVAGEQSSRNWGWIRQQGRDFSELPIAITSGALWREISDELGNPFGLSQCGIVYTATTQDELARFSAWQERAAPALDTRMLSQSELKETIGDHPDILGALYTPSDMRAEPWLAGPAIASALDALPNVTICERCAGRSLEFHAGRLNEVVTEKGAIRCDHAVVAGGAWSSLLMRNLGRQIPQLSVRASVGATMPLDDVIDASTDFPGFAMRRRLDGGYTLAAGNFHEFFMGPDAFRYLSAFRPALKAVTENTRFLAKAPRGYPDGWGTKREWSGDEVTPFEKMRVLDPTPNFKKLEDIRSAFSQRFPQLGTVRYNAQWAGMIDTLPDQLPIVDHVPKLQGVVLATGMAGHGFGIAPGFGQIIARLIIGQPVQDDISRFRFDRFRPGAPFTPTSALSY